MRRDRRCIRSSTTDGPTSTYYGDTSQCAAIDRRRSRTGSWRRNIRTSSSGRVNGSRGPTASSTASSSTSARFPATRRSSPTSTPPSARLTAGGARVVFLPRRLRAYPSARGLANTSRRRPPRPASKLLRSYARQHPDKVVVIDLPTILQCPTADKCPAEVAPGIRPRALDGFHYDGDGAAWLAESARRHAARHHAAVRRRPRRRRARRHPRATA